VATQGLSMPAASIMAALLTEAMCAVAWRWVLVPLPSVPLPSVRHAITTRPHADITPIRLVIEFVC